MKRFLAIALVLLLLCGCSSAPAEDTVPRTVPPEQMTTAAAAAPTEPEFGWRSGNGVTLYLNADGTYHTGWLDENGKRYYFDQSGILQTGWLTLEGKQYYFHPDGTMARGNVAIDGETFHFASNGTKLLLVNPWTFLPEDYTPDLVEAENGYLVDRSCYEDLMRMLSDCRAAGCNAQICSSYRDNDLQVYLYNRKVNYFLGLGYSEADAKKEAGTIIAVPGTSEHQLGLALDLVDNSYWGLDEAQEDTPAQKWLMANCWNYGFILRYPNEKSQQTGIIYEPWHYRYVGHTVARELYESGQCLEEYLDNLTQ